MLLVKVRSCIFQEKLDPLVLNFVELGYVENLKWRYMGKNRQCSNSITSTNKDDMDFDLSHTRGLFVFLLVGVGVAICLLILEHITYFVILPRLKKKPPDSIWKKRNVEYFSQVSCCNTVFITASHRHPQPSAHPSLSVSRLTSVHSRDGGAAVVIRHCLSVMASSFFRYV